MGFIRDKTVKNRKPCQCFGCERWFPAGHEMRKVTASDESYIYTIPLCVVCSHIIDEFYRHDDEFGFGEVRDGDSEYWENTRKEFEE